MNLVVAGTYNSSTLLQRCLLYISFPLSLSLSIYIYICLPRSSRSVSVRLADAQIYHTKRMQRVFTARYSMDATYVLSGSDDFNLRLWKAHAAEKLGIVMPRERKHIAYMEAVKERYTLRIETKRMTLNGMLFIRAVTSSPFCSPIHRYSHLDDIRRIDRRRHLPRSVYKKQKLRQEVIQAHRRKEERRRKHSDPEAADTVSARRRKILHMAE